MVSWLKRLQKVIGTASHSKPIGVIELTKMGIASGFRIGEFTQFNINSDTNKPHTNKFGDVQRLAAHDFMFTT